MSCDFETLSLHRDACLIATSKKQRDACLIATSKKQRDACLIAESVEWRLAGAHYLTHRGRFGEQRQNADDTVRL